MGLVDLFRPKWKHSQAEVRLAAIESLEDQNILAEIARTDPDTEVRAAVLPKLEDRSVLKDIVNGDEDLALRMQALTLIQDPYYIKAFVSNQDREEKLRCVAVEMLDDQTALGQLVRDRESEKVYLAAFARLEDPFQLSLVAIYFKGDLSLRAVERLEDQRLLAKVVDEASWPGVNSAAVNKITDLDRLCEIATTTKDGTLQIQVIENLRDEERLARLAKTVSSDVARIAALKASGSQDLAEELGRNDESWAVRDEAARIIVDDAILAEMAQNDVSEIVRKSARNRIRDPEQRAAIKGGGDGADASDIAIEGLHLNVADLEGMSVTDIAARLAHSVLRTNYASQEQEEEAETAVREFGNALAKERGFPALVACYKAVLNEFGEGKAQVLNRMWYGVGERYGQAWLGA